MRSSKMRNMAEKKQQKRYQKVRNLVRSKLQETGDLERLRCFVRRRLTAAGWKGDMIRELRDAVHENGICNVTVEDLYDRIAVSGRKIDEVVKEEALRKIKHCYKDALSGKTNLELDRVSEVIANNDSLAANIRYITEHRN